MKTTVHNIFKVSIFVFVMVLAGMSETLAQATIKSVPEGQEFKVLGMINTRSADSFKMTALDNTSSYVVALTPATTVKANTKGVFRGGKEYGVSYLLRGLRIEVEGTGNAEGQLVAKSIRFNETDLRTAQSLESRMDPVEQQANSNTERITAGEQNAQRMSGQIEENTALALQAQATADRANNRINGLNEFDNVKTITVVFATGSSTLGPKGRQTIDEAAAWVKTQDTKGWMVAVVGFADSTGNSAKNKALSERRANEVIGYMVSKHSLPLQRLIQPFGAGVDQPAATNETAEGRAANRRVEIRLLVNKGIAGR